MKITMNAASEINFVFIIIFLILILNLG
jgi:hypothetical protein